MVSICSNDSLLLERIKAYEWKWYIDSDIRGYEYWDKKLQEIGELVGFKRIIRRIGYDIILGEEVDLLRISCFSEFDSEGTGVQMFYEDPHGAKWYVRKK